MDLISVEGLENAIVICWKNKNGDLWVIMKDFKDGLGVKNMSGLVLREIYGVYEKKNYQMKELNTIKWLKENFLKRFMTLTNMI